MCWFLDEYLEVGEGVGVDGCEPAVPQEYLLQVGQVLLEHASLQPYAARFKFHAHPQTICNFQGCGSGSGGFGRVGFSVSNLMYLFYNIIISQLSRYLYQMASKKKVCIPGSIFVFRCVKGI